MQRRSRLRDGCHCGGAPGVDRDNQELQDEGSGIWRVYERTRKLSISCGQARAPWRGAPDDSNRIDHQFGCIW